VSLACHRATAQLCSGCRDKNWNFKQSLRSSNKFHENFHISNKTTKHRLDL
jgi:hypothetical protein